MDYAEHEVFARTKLPAREDYVLLAESFSGPIGIAIAASKPAGLRGLILCVSFASNPLPVFSPFSRLIGAFPAPRVPPSLAAPWLYAGRATLELRRAHAAAMAKVSARALSARVAAILSVDQCAQLTHIDVPILYLRAKADRLVGESATRAILRARPETEVVEFDAPHFLLQTEPEACAAVTRTFMQRCQR
jgi:pimeloyl-[acyl-carrier protein] methyl ester esterase